jgi:hypothetical protein
MADWGMQQVKVPKNAAILDVGCGGGWMVRRLAALASEGKVIGLDYPAASVTVSLKHECQGDRGRMSADRAGFGGCFAVPRSHVRRSHRLKKMQMSPDCPHRPSSYNAAVPVPFRRAQTRVVKIFISVEGSRSSMMDVEDEHNRMGAAFWPT